MTATNPLDDPAIVRLHAAYRDIEEAAGICRLHAELVDDDHHPLHHPLLVAIIVSYGRPFTQGKGWGKRKPPLDLEIYPDVGDVQQFVGESELPDGVSSGLWGLPRSWRDMHTKIMDMRHQTIAHSDAEVRAPALGVDPEARDRHEFSRSLQYETLLDEDVAVIADMCGFAMETIGKLIAEAEAQHGSET